MRPVKGVYADGGMVSGGATGPSSKRVFTGRTSYGSSEDPRAIKALMEYLSSHGKGKPSAHDMMSNMDTSRTLEGEPAGRYPNNFPKYDERLAQSDSYDLAPDADSKTRQGVMEGSLIQKLRLDAENGYGPAQELLEKYGL
tara:strand:- start:1302 stop:1724 length:423 start_codon:yes stop_codon:yes gene_type:complete